MSLERKYLILGKHFYITKKTEMMQKNIIFLFLLFNFSSFAQIDLDYIIKSTIEIEKEGRQMYQLELTSWYGTDAFIAKYENKSNIGGYVSYIDGKTSKCIFISRAKKPVVIGTISFEGAYSEKAAKVNLEERALTQPETELLQMRANAEEVIEADTMFKTYTNTNFNIIPMIYKGQKKVYVLTGPTKTGVVILGNDYLITFNDDLSLKSKKTLHNNIIPLFYGNEEKKAETTMHSHLSSTGAFITPTDYCTLMLYAKYTGWTSHVVVSEKYLTMLDLSTGALTVVDKEETKEEEKDDQIETPEKH